MRKCFLPSSPDNYHGHQDYHSNNHYHDHDDVGFLQVRTLREQLQSRNSGTPISPWRTISININININQAIDIKIKSQYLHDQSFLLLSVQLIYLVFKMIYDLEKTSNWINICMSFITEQKNIFWNYYKPDLDGQIYQHS